MWPFKKPVAVVAISDEEVKRIELELKLKEEAKARIELEAKLRQQDEEERLEAKHYKPELSVIPGAMGEFLCVAGQEIPIWLIKSVEIDQHGYGVGMDFSGRLFLLRSSITIILQAGTVYSFNISRWYADIMVDALQKLTLPK